MLTTPTKTDTYIHEVVTHQQQEQKIVILKKGLFILNWKQISNKKLLQQSILQSINSSTTRAQHSEEYKLVNNMSLHQHSILKSINSSTT
jgi:hypothetical protein